MKPTRAKTALVTGGSRGIGRAIATQLSHRGIRVALHYHNNKAAGEQTLSTLAGEGHILVSADLTKEDGAALVANAAVKGLGGCIDVLVNNAGAYLESPVGETSRYHEWQASLRRQMQLNFFAGADLAYLVAPAMKEAGWGRIIQIASRSGLRGEAGFSAYSASKAAQINFAKSLAVELAPFGIGCFAIAPGWVETEMAAESLAKDGNEIRSAIPIGRLASPEDIAHLVGYLVTPGADYLTGNTIDVNGASYLH